MTNDVYFMVEGGKTLEAARAYVSERLALIERNASLLDELGASRHFRALDGTVGGIECYGEPPEGFVKPKSNGYTRPKKGSKWDERFKSQVGMSSHYVSQSLKIPMSISYEKSDSSGSSVIGRGFHDAAGFLFLSKEGPFCLYCLDIPALVKSYEDDGWTVLPPCKGFEMRFDGARQILKEEWEMLVASHKLDKAKAAA